MFGSDTGWEHSFFSIPVFFKQGLAAKQATSPTVTNILDN